MFWYEDTELWLINFCLLLVPPSIVADPPDGNFVVKKGKHIELRCKATGNPAPDVHWTKEVILFENHWI